jgi:hypothetical protein
MKKIFIFVLFALMIIPFRVNAEGNRSCMPNNVGYSYYDIDISFKKIDIETRNVLKDAYFNVSTLDNSFVFETINTFNIPQKSSKEKKTEIEDINSLSNIYLYFMKSEKTLPANELYNILPQSIQDLYDSINTIEDFDNNINGEYIVGSSNCTNRWEDEEGVAHNTTLKTYVYFPVKIVETKSPINYQKTEVIVPAVANLYFNYKEDEDVINNKQIQIIISANSFYKYDKSINYFDYVNGSVSFINYLDSNVEYYGSDIPDEKGTIDLKIDNTIENKYIYETGTNKRFTYKIIIENEGTASSGNDEIKIVVPKELEVYEDSISDDGKFNSKKNEIIWKLDYIDSNEKKELSFDIKAPSNSAGEYTLISSLNNNESSLNAPKITLKVKGKASNSDTIKNPDTGVSDYSSIMFIVIILSIGLYGLLKQKKDYLIK